MDFPFFFDQTTIPLWIAVRTDEHMSARKRNGDDPSPPAFMKSVVRHFHVNDLRNIEIVQGKVKAERGTTAVAGGGKTYHVSTRQPNNRDEYEQMLKDDWITATDEGKKFKNGSVAAFKIDLHIMQDDGKSDGA